MRVSMDAKDVTMTLGNNGIVLYVADNNNKHIRKLRIGKTQVEWCAGRTRIGNGKTMPLHRFISNVLEELK